MLLLDMLNILSETYYYGFIVMSLLIFIWAQRKKTNTASLNLSIRANNTLILIISVIFLFKELTIYFISWYSQTFYYQVAFNQEINSKYQITLFALTTIAHYLLPLIMLNKKLRKSIKSSLLIVALWIILTVLMQISVKASFSYFLSPKYISNIITKTLIYILLFSGVYFLIIRNNRRLLNTNNQL
jgi:hypothetical protein